MVWADFQSWEEAQLLIVLLCPLDSRFRKLRPGAALPEVVESPESWDSIMISAATPQSSHTHQPSRRNGEALGLRAIHTWPVSPTQLRTGASSGDP